MQEELIEGFRLSPQQRRLWSPARGDGGRALCVVLVEGALDRRVLLESLHKVVERCEILRTTFRRLPGMAVPVQVIMQECSPAVRELDLSALGRREQEERIETLSRELSGAPLRPEHDAPLRAALVTLSPETHQLLITLPALCADAKALENLAGDIARCYGSMVSGDELPEAPMQYADLSEWLNDMLLSESAQAGREFWRRQELPEPAARLPFARRAPSRTGFEPRSISRTLTARLADGAAEVAAQCGVTTPVLLSACWYVLLARLSGQAGQVVGWVCDGRNYNELEEVVGLFERCLPISCELTETSGLRDLLARLDEARGEAAKWQDCLDWERPEHAGAQEPEPFIPFCFEHRARPQTIRAQGLSFSTVRLSAHADRFDLKLSCVQSEGSLVTEFHYDAGLFDEKDVERLADSYHALLESAVIRPGVPVGRLSSHDGAEEARTLAYSRGPLTGRREQRLVHQLFEAQAESQPEAVAAVFEEKHSTFSELNRRANRLARHLRALGVGPDVVVGICVGRSPEMLVGLLGVLKAGGAYLPLDPNYPQERQAYMLENARARVVLTQGVSAVGAGGTTEVSLDAVWADSAERDSDNPSVEVGPENLAYVIYTSGSTGRPKGVAIEHRQLSNYLDAVSERLSLPQGSSYAMVSTFAADLCNTVLYPALCTGGTLHVVSPETAFDAGALARYFSRHTIDCLKIVPSHIEALLSSDSGARVLPRWRLVLGGEASDWGLVEKIRALSPECRVVNHYGPTETTVGVLTYSVGGDSDEHPSLTLPLGHPLANTQVYLLDSEMRPVPTWQTGEVYVGGDCVGRGYLNRPALTAEKFVPDPFGPRAGARLYRTGDRARRHSDGSLEFLGRGDQQVKIRGFRIELGEIEAVLNQEPCVEQAVVTVVGETPETRRLAAYLVPRTAQVPQLDEVRASLARRLPEHMMPSAFTLLDRLPLTPNGKLDRNALPAPDPSQETGSNYVAPRTAVEETVAQIWAEVLHVKQVGVHDDFFRLGGHSLLITQIVSRINRAYQIELPLQSMFEVRTIETLSQVVETAVRAGAQVRVPKLTRVARDAYRATLSPQGMIEIPEA